MVDWRSSLSACCGMPAVSGSSATARLHAASSTPPNRPRWYQPEGYDYTYVIMPMHTCRANRMYRSLAQSAGERSRRPAEAALARDTLRGATPRALPISAKRQSGPDPSLRCTGW